MLRTGALIALALFVALEISVRRLHDSKRNTRFDARGLYLNRPNALIFGEHPTNANGFLGDELRDPKPKEEYRVFLLSDTTSLSIELLGALQDALQARMPDRRVIVNIGSAPRYTSWHTRRLVEDHLLVLAPDCFVVHLGVGDNLFDAAPGAEVPNPGFFDVDRWTASVLLQMAEYYFVERGMRRRTSFASGPLRSPAIFEENLRAIVEAAHQRGVKVVLLELAHVAETDDPALAREIEAAQADVEHAWGDVASARRAIAAHTEVVRRLAAEYDLPLGAPSTVLEMSARDFRDLVHLQEPSAAKLAGLIAGLVLDPRPPTTSTTAGR